MLAHLFGGQSNISHLWENAASAGTPEADTFMWNGSSWVPPVNALIAFANTLLDATGKPVYILPAAIGNTALLPESAAVGFSSGYWLNRDAGSPLKIAIGMIQASGAQLASVVWGQGERECESPQAVSKMRSGYAEVHAAFAGASSLSPDELPFILCPTAHWVTNFPTGGRRVSEAQQRAIETVKGFIRGPDSWDLTTYDGGHLDQSSCIMFAQRIAAKLAPIVGIKPIVVQSVGGSSGSAKFKAKTVDVDISSTTPFTVSGIGFQPVGAFIVSGGNGWIGSVGLDDLSGGESIYTASGGYNPFGDALTLVASVGNYWHAHIASVTADSATFTPTKTGSPTGSYTVKIGFIG